MKASVVIPAKNAGTQFRKVLSAVLAQKTQDPFDVVVVDSGSTDGTWEYLEDTAKADRRLVLHRIPPAEFQHGLTRNEGIRRSTGDIVALTTQDALPANDEWLQRLVDAIAQDDAIGGAFGRHLAYPDHPVCIRRDLVNHFATFDKWPAVMRIDDKARYEADTTYRQILHFFSNNNSAMRRTVWEKIPLPEVAFGEDQAWSEAMLKAGYARAYAKDAVVYHSHKYGVQETFRRCREESTTYRERFGYRLVPTRKEILGHILGQIRADLDYVRRHPDETRGLWDVLQAAPLNAARILGYRAGS